MYEYYAKIRDSKGLTDYAVSKLSGVSRSTLSDWKTGKHTPNHENIKKLSTALGVEPWTLLGWEDYSFLKDEWQDEIFAIDLEDQRKKENDTIRRLMLYNKLFNEMLPSLLDDDMNRALLTEAEGCTRRQKAIAIDILREFKEENNQDESK